DGQLGTGSNDDSSVPAQVSAAASFVALSAGDFHTCALSSDAATWCWGWNAAGQLGIGTTISTSAPTAVGGAVAGGHGAAAGALAHGSHAVMERKRAIKPLPVRQERVR